MSEIFCPICNCKSNHSYSVAAKHIKEQLEKYYEEQINLNINSIDYEMYKCPKCLLEFSEPEQPGNSNFYKWIANHHDYYPKHRWEWSSVIDKIKKHKKNDNTCINILEIGCGTGAFLKFVRENINASVIGLDTNEDSVKLCNKIGIETYCENIDSFSKRQPQKFDYIVVFHCLEHVSAPKDFVKSMLPLIKSDGKIFLSTPYSPMYFEYSYFDILNHPPHHLTRWNERAYKELASQLGLNINIYMPMPISIIRRVVGTAKLKFVPRSKMVDKKYIIMKLIMHPIFIIKECIKQFRREKVNGRFAADVVLVELFKGK